MGLHKRISSKVFMHNFLLLVCLSPSFAISSYSSKEALRARAIQTAAKFLIPHPRRLSLFLPVEVETNHDACVASGSRVEAETSPLGGGGSGAYVGWGKLGVVTHCAPQEVKDLIKLWGGTKEDDEVVVKSLDVRDPKEIKELETYACKGFCKSAESQCTSLQRLAEQFDLPLLGVTTMSLTPNSSSKMMNRRLFK